MTESTEDPGAEQHTAAREAISRGDWLLAYELLAKADASKPLSPPDLMLFAETAYAAGYLEVTLEALERAHSEALRSGDRVGAAAAAVRFAMHLIIDTGLLAPVRAWIRRSELTLEGLGDTPVHAWLAVARACERMLAGDFTGGREWAQQAIDVGDRHAERGAAMFGRNVYARCLIFDGEVERGLGLLDDVAECLLTGELDPLTTGLLYCEVVCAWQGVARYDKAEEWTDAMERFSRDHAIGSVNGRCRVHRAEILRLRGALSDAEREALEACEQLRPYMRYEFGWPLTELGRIRLTRGDIAGAQEAFVEAHEMGWDPEPGLALSSLAQGDAAGAAATVQDALDHPVNTPSKERPPNSELRRAPLLEAQVEIAIAARDVDVARKACDELGQIALTFKSKALDAGYALACGRVRLAEGDASGARNELQTAVRLWSEIGAPVETAIARTLLAQAHHVTGNEQNAALELRAARSTFARVGAESYATSVSQTLADAADEPASERAIGTTDSNEFRREGDYWSITFAGRTVRLRDMKGLQHLSRLLADPGREFHAVDLATLGRGSVKTIPPRAESGLSVSLDNDAGELLDARAKDVYRRRLQEIDEDIADAETFGDSERAARARFEREFLLRELSRAVGLSGRDRRAGATSERARASVTRAIRHALARIGEEHAALGEHLDRAVRTGTYCVYLPDPRVPVDWVL
jgi:tetratricopeptide (TPR) repeat protein